MWQFDRRTIYHVVAHIFLLTVTVTCSSIAPSKTLESMQAGTAEITPIQKSLATPTSIPKGTETARITSTSTPENTATPTLLPPTPSATASDIWKRFIKNAITAYWSEDGETLYFLSSRSSFDEAQYTWWAYDPKTDTRTESMVHAGFDEIDWEQAGITDKFEQENLYIYGCVSPSGEHVVYSKDYYQSSGSLENRVEFWLADTDGQRNIKVFEHYWGWGLSAEWTSDESKVYFSYYGDAIGGDIALVDVSSGSSEWVSSTAGAWALSPDEQYIAVEEIIDPGFKYVIELKSLEDGTTSIFDRESAWPFSWSRDSRYLYYWTQYELDNPGDPESDIQVYELATGEISQFIEGTRLAELDESLLQNEFAVSPDGKKIAFWTSDGPLWLVFLEDR